MPSTTPFAAAAACLALMGAAGPAAHADTAPDPSVHACYSSFFQLLRLAGPGCLAGEHSISWNQRGPAGAPGVSGYEIVTATTAMSTTVAKNVVAHCPDGKHVLGGGLTPLSGSGAAIVTEISYPPDPEGTSWFVQAEDISHTGASWSLEAFAICAKVG